MSLPRILVGVVFVSLTSLAACSSPEDALKEHDKQVLAEQKQRAEQEAARKAQVNANKDTIFQQGMDFLEAENFQGATRKFREVQEVAPNYPGLNERLAEAERGEQEALQEQREQQAATEREGKKILRLAAEDLLRERYLDAGMDIKVNVSGKNADRIILTYVLFNDVWTHRFQKDGGLNSLREMGFKRVDLKDGYDYHVYWTF